jgi:hypothetical protein
MSNRTPAAIAQRIIEQFGRDAATEVAHAILNTPPGDDPTITLTAKQTRASQIPRGANCSTCGDFKNGICGYTGVHFENPERHLCPRWINGGGQ